MEMQKLSFLIIEKNKKNTLCAQLWRFYTYQR